MSLFIIITLLTCELQEQKTKVTQINVQEAMRKKGKTPMFKDREKTPACNRATDSQERC